MNWNNPLARLLNSIRNSLPSGDDSNDNDADDSTPRPIPVERPESPSRTIRDGELLVYTHENIEEMSVEMYNQLLHGYDLDEGDAQEIADMFYALHRLDEREFALMTE